MTTSRLAVSGVALCLLAGCGPDSTRAPAPRPGHPAAGVPAEPPSPQQAAIAAKLAAAGVHTPPLHRVLRRRTHEIHGFTIATADALAMWERLRAVTDQTGYYPLIVTELGALADYDEEIEATDPEEVLAASEGIDARVWFDKQRELEPELEEHLDRGEWSEAEPPSELYILSPDGPGTTGSVQIALVPTTKPWEVPAYMTFGGFNACPDADVHVAVHRSWHERFGAEIVAMGGDYIEMRAARPPQDNAAAEALAMEQFVYTAGDLVYQGTQTLLALASTLKGGTWWYFWWD